MYLGWRTRGPLSDSNKVRTRLPKSLVKRQAMAVIRLNLFQIRWRCRILCRRIRFVKARLLRLLLSAGTTPLRPA
jgi:hypothetical protein